MTSIRLLASSAAALGICARVLRQDELDHDVAALEQTLFPQSFPEATDICWWRAARRAGTQCGWGLACLCLCR
jgi:hypothetical protein